MNYYKKYGVMMVLIIVFAPLSFSSRSLADGLPSVTYAPPQMEMRDEQNPMAMGQDEEAISMDREENLPEEMMAGQEEFVTEEEITPKRTVKKRFGGRVKAPNIDTMSLQSKIPAREGIIPHKADYAYKKLEIAVSSAELIRFDKALSDIFVADPSIADVTVNTPHSFYVQAGRLGRTTIIGYDQKGGLSILFDVHVVVDTKKLEHLIESVEPDIDIEATATPQGILLRGVLDSAEQAAFVERLALQYLSSVLEGDVTNVLINQMRVNAPNQVNLQVRIAEVSRQAGEYISLNFGFNNSSGSSSFGAGTGSDNSSNVSGGVLNFFRGVNQLSGKVADSLALLLTKPWGTLYTILDLLEDEGMLLTLAQPNLTAVSGETASFLAGGQIPVASVSNQVGVSTITTELLPFGVELSFTPVILSGERISLEIAARVSDIDETITPDGGTPGFRTRQAQTTVEIASGQNFAIAGLLQNRMASQVRQLPGIADIPIIGALFRSDSFRNSQSELVIIVTPLLVEPASDQALATPVERFSFNTQLERWLTGRVMEYSGVDIPIEQIVMAPRYLEIGGFMLE